MENAFNLGVCYSKESKAILAFLSGSVQSKTSYHRQEAEKRLLVLYVPRR